MIWAGLITLGCTIRPVAIGISLANLPQNVVIDQSKLAVLIGATAIGIVIALAIAFCVISGRLGFLQPVQSECRQIGSHFDGHTMLW